MCVSPKEVILIGLRNVPGITLNIIVGALLVLSVALPAVLQKVAAARDGARS
jgi:hypothetical protein